MFIPAAKPAVAPAELTWYVGLLGSAMVPVHVLVAALIGTTMPIATVANAAIATACSALRMFRLDPIRDRFMCCSSPRPRKSPTAADRPRSLFDAAQINRI